jgi:phosphoserine / homoserine phosphotransferase
MYIICSDLEGVFVPEIWVNVAKQTGIEELKLTTRDVSDYNVLMQGRLRILRENKITLHDLHNVISRLQPLPGALEFLEWIRSVSQIIIVSDTFTEFASPLMKQLGWPTLLCHNLTVDASGNIIGYNLRQPDSKRKVAESLQNLNYRVIGIGDSYNDISMLRKADTGILFNPPQNVIEEHGDLKIVKSYNELKSIIDRIIS